MNIKTQTSTCFQNPMLRLNHHNSWARKRRFSNWFWKLPEVEACLPVVVLTLCLNFLNWSIWNCRGKGTTPVMLQRVSPSYMSQATAPVIAKLTPCSYLASMFLKYGSRNGKPIAEAVKSHLNYKNDKRDNFKTPPLCERFHCIDLKYETQFNI